TPPAAGTSSSSVSVSSSVSQATGEFFSSGSWAPRSCVLSTIHPPSFAANDSDELQVPCPESAWHVACIVLMQQGGFERGEEDIPLVPRADSKDRRPTAAGEHRNRADAAAGDRKGRGTAMVRGEAEERLQFALDAARMGTWSWSPQNDVSRLDDRALEIFGGDLGSDFSFAASIRDHLPPENVEQYQQCVRQIMDARDVDE